MPSRCPNGSRRNNKTGNCVKNSEKSKTSKKRCPNGSKRYPPKTGNCIKNNNKTKSKSKSPKIKTKSNNTLSTSEIKKVIQEFSENHRDEDYFMESEKKEIIKNAKLHNITSKKVLYEELSKYHKGHGLVAYSPI
jgi:hypothetical protein